MSHECKNLPGSGTLTCKTCIDLLCDYLDGTLPEEESKALESHLAACPPCVTFVNTYRSTGRWCRKALQTELPPELGDKLTAFLRGKIGKK